MQLRKQIGKLATLGLAATLAVGAMTVAPVAWAAVAQPAPAAAPVRALTGGAWNFVSMGPSGAPVNALPGATLTLVFGSDGQASGNGGCNNFSGAFHPGASSLTFDPLVSTKRACADAGLTTQESAYLAALQAVTSYTLNGDQLTLSGPSTVLHFTRAAATTPANDWTRAQFGSQWDMAYPAGWQVQSDFSTVQLTGPWQGHTFKVTLSYPLNPTATTLDEWVASAIDQLPGSQTVSDFAVSNLTVAGAPARLVRAFPAGAEPSPRHLVFVWQWGMTAPRLVVVTQTDDQGFDDALMADFLTEFVGQLRDPQGGVVTPSNPVTPTTPVSPLAEARVPGIISYQGDVSSVLSAPATVAVGQAFSVTITTFGGGCDRAADAAAIVDAAGATLVAYDFTRATTPDVLCTAILQRLTHTVTVRFDQPGEMVLRLWGRRVGADTPAIGVLELMEQHVTVQ